MKKFGGLRVESSKGFSGKLLNEQSVNLLKENQYYIHEVAMIGDAPKQMIRAYIYRSESGVRKDNPRTWRLFICKSAEKWYPIETVTEYMINKIGYVSGININHFEIVKANGQLRFLSQYFLKKNEKLVHGAEIIGEFIEDISKAIIIANDKRQSSEQFTYELIKRAIKAIFPNYADSIQVEFVKMLIFDAIVGNNDRHFYNWGVISNLKKKNNIVTFAPVYDTARGLLWNIPDKDLSSMIENTKKIDRYINKSMPRIGLEGKKKVTHFDLIEFIVISDEKFKAIALDLISIEKENQILEMLRKDLFYYFSPYRSKLIEIILTKRYKHLREICGAI